MALSVGSGENKQKLIKILVFVPSGSIVGFTRSARASAGANKNRHLKTFRTRKPTARFALRDCAALSGDWRKNKDLCASALSERRKRKKGRNECSHLCMGALSAVF